MNEQETRTEYILPALQKAGWGIIEGSKIREEFPISKGRLIGHGQRSKPDKADYVLQYRNRNLAIVEAKKRDSDYTEGVAQAKDYAGKLQVRFTYSTNGLKIYGMDMSKGAEGDVTVYPSPDELWEMTFGEQNKLQPQSQLVIDKLLSVPYETKSGTKPPRFYQENAVANVLSAMAQGKHRILLTLATGTGKTDIAFQITWKLFKSKWNIKGDGERSPRILFLTDRNYLANQAISKFNEYGAFEEDALVRINPESIRQRGRVPTNGSIFFTIFQTFMTNVHGQPPGVVPTFNFGEYPKDFFDIIIIDECHRGGASDESTWRAILEHFSPAVQLGMTATPKRDNNIDTYKYFGEPVYVYSLKEGINDGFLTPFKVRQIDTTIDEYVYTSDDEVLEGEIEEGKQYTEAEMNRVISIEEREKYRVKIFMDLIDQSEKTLVFCATQLHALAIRNLINQIAKSKNPDYCHRVTADEGKLGEQYLKYFQDNEKSIPTILTTSQKLSTGVDAPEVRNIVLLRPVNSMIEFKQIIGRGTRLFDGKDYFTIYDFVKSHHHFSDTEWDGEPLEPDTQKEKQSKVYPLPSGRKKFDDPPTPEPYYEMIKIKLADGKVRELQHIVSTSFYSPDGKPISAEEFLQTMFGTLPEFFKDENELRTIWSKPDTRKKLLEELSEKGFTKSQLNDLQKMICAEKSDLYDVLAYVAFHSKLIKRSIRAEKAKIHFNNYNSKQQEFLNFVLMQYVNSGVEELSEEKLTPLLILKYKAIPDAKQELGDISSIRNLFIEFQPFLYDYGIAV
ncbi:MAG: restriction endonuclease subunit R [Bacteroidetes bacterium RIFCSPLOWO2_02_FULL_36_8]|nr:MAG: restriction endonuclease subunit R [Bacteroidetes bacterium RIFCSPLOWO2_02_FULL_36_8]OFY70376.1 MAG: restriction endonuclease subunit R [Bacteroidetes bacterium RIFCSPLOWO2_12_FULL_37_12]